MREAGISPQQPGIACDAELQAGIHNGWSAAPAYPLDIVDLHESIAKLLAAQQKWAGAYEHIQTALKLYREYSTSGPRLPEQHQRDVVRPCRVQEHFRDSSTQDELTPTYDRRYLDTQLVRVLAEHADEQHGLAIALVDLDHFTRINSNFGYTLGDSVVRTAVTLLQTDLPTGAFCARYGGEEFVLVLPSIDERQAVTTLERARARIAEYDWSALATTLKVTISAGLVHHPSPTRPHLPRSAPSEAERQIRRADDLLYAAKRSGRNAVAYRKDEAIRFAGRDDNCR